MIEASFDTHPINNQTAVDEKISISLRYLEQQTQFIDKIMKAIQADELETVLRILDENKTFVTHDFVQSFSGKAIANYLVESASHQLMRTFPFLHQLMTESMDQKRTFYIGEWYKADTRHILFLAINLMDNRYRLTLNLAPEVLEEWNNMEQVKGNIHNDLSRKEEELLQARQTYETKKKEALTRHSHQLDELRKKYHTLTSKVLKKQSEIQEIDQEIKKETQVIRNIEEQPDIFFNDEYQAIVSAQESIEALKARVENMNLIEALVKREKNEIEHYGLTVDQFIHKIDLLSEQWGNNH